MGSERQDFLPNAHHGHGRMRWSSSALVGLGVCLLAFVSRAAAVDNPVILRVDIKDGTDPDWILRYAKYLPIAPGVILVGQERIMSWLFNGPSGTTGWVRQVGGMGEVVFSGEVGNTTDQGEHRPLIRGERVGTVEIAARATLGGVLAEDRYTPVVADLHTLILVGNNAEYDRGADPGSPHEETVYGIVDRDRRAKLMLGCDWLAAEEAREKSGGTEAVPPAVDEANDAPAGESKVAAGKDWKVSCSDFYIKGGVAPFGSPGSSAAPPRGLGRGAGLTP